MQVVVIDIFYEKFLYLLTLFIDTTVRIDSPTDAEVEERNVSAFSNVYIPKSGGVQ